MNARMSPVWKRRRKQIRTWLNTLRLIEAPYCNITSASETVPELQVCCFAEYTEGWQAVLRYRGFSESSTKPIPTMKKRPNERACFRNRSSERIHFKSRSTAMYKDSS